MTEINPVSNVSVGDLGGKAAATRLGDTTSERADAFGDSIGGALRGLQDAEASADAAALAGATGDLSSISDYMIAATEAQLMTEVTVAVRNRAIESFNEIMRMQV